jgi:hypothetical protein
LRIVPTGGGKPEVLAKLFGGQGTINVPVLLSGQPEGRFCQLPIQVSRLIEQDAMMPSLEG